MMDGLDKAELVECGFTIGDALRLKRAASVWWASPDAKRTHRRSPTPIPTVREDLRERIRFEKRFADKTGCTSVFGPGIIPGKNLREKEFVWWFFNTVTRVVEKVPDGFVPDIDAEYLDFDAPPFEPSPSPDPIANTD